MTNNIDPIYLKLFESKPGRGEKMKADIIKAAIHCIAAVGIENTTFESIGKLLKVRKSHVAYHFSDKQDIIEAAVKYITATAQQITIKHIKDAQKSEDLIRASIYGAFDWAAKYPEQLSVMFLFFYYCTYREEYRALYTEIRTTGTNRLAALLKNHKHPIELARQIQNLITGGMIEAYVTNPKVRKSVLRDQTLRYALELLRLDPILSI